MTGYCLLTQVGTRCGGIENCRHQSTGHWVRVTESPFGWDDYQTRQKSMVRKRNENDHLLSGSSVVKFTCDRKLFMGKWNSLFSIITLLFFISLFSFSSYASLYEGISINIASKILSVCKVYTYSEMSEI